MATRDSGRPGRVCVIGLDGVPFDLLRDLARTGVMPAVAALLERGHLHQIKASLPEISSVSWTSFMTGTNAGQHGIYGFTDLADNTYRMRFPSFLDVKAPTFWDRLGETGRRSIVVNQPFTYPARKIEGALVSGFVAIELAKAVYPFEHLASLEKMGYQIDIDTLKARQDHEFLWEDLDRTLESGRRAFEYFWPQEWDYFEFVVTGTDRLHHYLWTAYSDPRHGSRARFLRYYRQVDGLIDQIAHEFEKLTGGVDGLYLLSDHGFTAIEQEVYLNVWLQQEGYLRFDTSPPQRLSDITPGSRAFAMDPNRIYLNVEGKFPRGVVAGSERRALKEEIAQGVSRLEHNGRKVVRRVFDGEEIYTGPHKAKGPDLVVLAENGFDMKGAIDKHEMFGRSDLVGMHTWDDAFFWAAKDAGPNLWIGDLAAVIMQNFQ